MTRRDRLEAKLEKCEEWAGKADARSASAFARADRIADTIPFGQPILVGHHSEAHARADQTRIHNAMDKGCAEANLADYHESKATGLARQLKTTVFSDDDNAIEALEGRMARHEATAAGWIALNKAWRKSKGDVATFAGLASISVETAQVIANGIATAYSWEKQPIPAYQLTNMRARIRTDRERIEQIKVQQARAEKAEQAGGVVIEGTGEWVRVTFAEKPGRDILDALHAAEFQWGAGSWVGRRVNLPTCIQESANA